MLLEATAAKIIYLLSKLQSKTRSVKTFLLTLKNPFASILQLVWLRFKKFHGGKSIKRNWWQMLTVWLQRRKWSSSTTSSLATINGEFVLMGTTDTQTPHVKSRRCWWVDKDTVGWFTLLNELYVSFSVEYEFYETVKMKIWLQKTKTPLIHPDLCNLTVRIMWIPKLN